MKWLWCDIRQISNTEYKMYYEFMSREKRARIKRYHFADDKKRTIAGEMIARRMISDSCGVEESSIVFLKNKYGKSYVQDLQVHFNISHSGNMVVCAVADASVGIDVEKIRPIDLSISEQICTNNELEYIDYDMRKKRKSIDYKSQDSSEWDKYRRFFEIWTLKEAYFKCMGTGICNLKSVDVFQMEEKHKCILLKDYIISIVIHAPA